jgi:hypothetical protein
MRLAPDAGDRDIGGALRFAARSKDGNRNKSLYWAACRARELVEERVITEASAERRLGEAAAAAGLPELESFRTIRSGLGLKSGGQA